MWLSNDNIVYKENTGCCSIQPWVLNTWVVILYPCMGHLRHPISVLRLSSPGITICLNLQLHLRKQPPLMLFSQIKSHHLLSAAPLALTARPWLAAVPLEARLFCVVVVAGAVLLELPMPSRGCPHLVCFGPQDSCNFRTFCKNSGETAAHFVIQEHTFRFGIESWFTDIISFLWFHLFCSTGEIECLSKSNRWNYLTAKDFTQPLFSDVYCSCIKNGSVFQIGIYQTLWFGIHLGWFHTWLIENT